MNLEYADLYLELLEDNTKAMEYAKIEYDKRSKNSDTNLMMAKIYAADNKNEAAKKHVKAASIVNSKNDDLIALKKQYQL